MSNFFEKLEKWVHTAAEWRYLPVFLFAWTLVDYFTFLLPADAVFAAAILGCNKRIIPFSVAVILARIVGTVAVFYIAHEISLDQLFLTAESYHLGEAWQKSRYFFEKFGPVSLGFISVLPFPPMQFIVVLSTAAGASLLTLQLYLIPGLILKCFVIYYAVKSGVYVVEKTRKRNRSQKKAV